MHVSIDRPGLNVWLLLSCELGGFFVACQIRKRKAHLLRQVCFVSDSWHRTWGGTAAKGFKVVIESPGQRVDRDRYGRVQQFLTIAGMRINSHAVSLIV